MHKRLIILLLLLIITMVLKNISDTKIVHYPTKIEVLNPVVNSSEPNLIRKMATENNQIYGWININDTKIDYPVMYSGDDYYLNHDFYHNKYDYGSLFIDKHNSIYPRDINLIIHGHNASNGTMFGSLKKYKDYNYYLNHKTFTFETEEQKYEYEIIAVFLSKIYYTTDNNFKYYKFYNTNSENIYNEFIKNVKKLSLYDTKITPKFPNNLITLSTCDDNNENGRLVVIAREVTTI